MSFVASVVFHTREDGFGGPSGVLSVAQAVQGETITFLEMNYQ